MWTRLAVLCSLAFSISALAGPKKLDTKVEVKEPSQCVTFKIDPKASKPMRAVKLPPKPGACHVQSIHGLVVPDPSCTPGAINPTMTVDVLKDPTWTTKCERDDTTTAAQKAKTYGWYGIPHPKDNTGANQVCELDHLISLELGGADTLDNLWPQCGPSEVALNERYFKRKDAVENYLAREVKAGRLTLAGAQQGISSDWTQYLEAASAPEKKEPAAVRVSPPPVRNPPEK